MGTVLVILAIPICHISELPGSIPAANKRRQPVRQSCAAALPGRDAIAGIAHKLILDVSQTPTQSHREDQNYSDHTDISFEKRLMRWRSAREGMGVGHYALRAVVGGSATRLSATGARAESHCR